VLKYLVDRPARQVIVPAKGTEKALDVRDCVLASRQSLEAVLFYAATQLALWLAKPKIDVIDHEMDMDEKAQTELHGSEKERRAARRQSATIAERLRRGMTGEMAADMQALLTKAKPVVAKSQTVLDSKAVDLTSVLSQFVHERIMLG
jgi:nuclear pore complex protein Nup188